MSIEDVFVQAAIIAGKELIALGVRKLGEYLTDEEIRETVEMILPAESMSRKAQREIERNLRKLHGDQ